MAFDEGLAERMRRAAHATRYPGAKGYVCVAPAGCRKAIDLERLVEAARAFARRLPKKRASKD